MFDEFIDEDKVTAQKVASLRLYRKAYAGTHRRARAVWALVGQLRGCRIWVPRAWAISQISSRLFWQAGEERECSEQEFGEELAMQLDQHWPVTDEPSGRSYLLQPFFDPSPAYLNELDLGGLRGCSMAELYALRDAPAREYPAGDVLGLSGCELTAMASLHRVNVLRLVNTMRHAATAVRYQRNALSRLSQRGRASAPLKLDPEIEAVLDQLETVLQLPGAPAPAAYFSSDSDRINNLRALPEDSELMSHLCSLAPEGLDGL